ncbi:MAG: glycosyltransferase family 39 protein [Pirellulaceae bacterium]
MPQVSFARLSLLTMIVLSVLFTHLGSARLWDRDEPRNARASHEMLERGDWIVPTFNGELRAHKPILLYWGQMTSYLALGESEFTARLPSALAALLAIVCVAVLATRLSGTPRGINRDGYWAAGTLATCLLFVMAGRAATPDACLIGFSTAGIVALVLSTLAPEPPYSSGRVAAARWLPAMIGYLMLGLAALAKGPVGIILPLAVVGLWWLVCRRLQERIKPADQAQASWRTRSVAILREAWYTLNPWQCLIAIWKLKTIPGLLLALLAAAPWYVAVGLETNGAFLRGFFLEHNLGRAVSSMEGHGGSILFYPVAFLVGTFPWSLWLIPIAMWARGASRENVLHRQTTVLAAAWIGTYMAAFSLASTKLPSYITPCYAGAALIIGGYWRQFESTWALPVIGWRRTAHALAIVTGCTIALAVYWLSSMQAMPALAGVAACGVVLAIVGILGFVWESTSRQTWMPTTWLIGAGIFQVILFGFGTATVDGYRRDLQLLTTVQRDTQAEHWLSIGGMEPSWVHYLNREIVEVQTHASGEESWDRVSDFLAKHPDGNVIVVGQDAQVGLHKFASLLELTEVTTDERFLRPGNISVYRRSTRAASQPNLLQR